MQYVSCATSLSQTDGRNKLSFVFNVELMISILTKRLWFCRQSLWFSYFFLIFCPVLLLLILLKNSTYSNLFAGKCFEYCFKFKTFTKGVTNIKNTAHFFAQTLAQIKKISKTLRKPLPSKVPFFSHFWPFSLCNPTCILVFLIFKVPLIFLLFHTGYQNSLGFVIYDNTPCFNLVFYFQRPVETSLMQKVTEAARDGE